MHSFCIYLTVNQLSNFKTKFMADNNRNQSNQTDQRNQQVEPRNTQSGQREDISTQSNDANPQRGTEWSNYQTRELSSNQNSSSTEDLSDE
jgi:hypothetical protein